MAPPEIKVGTVVADRRNPELPGVVLRFADDDSGYADPAGRVFVAWYGTCVESDPHVSELIVVENPPAEVAAWRGGFGIIEHGRARIEPA